MTIVDKNSVTQKGIRQYATCLSSDDVGKYALLPGDPARCDRTAKYLDDAKLVANNREHRTFTGYYKGVKVTVTSTGMGCPSASIATEELANCGVENFIRIGSSAAIKEGIKVGDLIVSTGAMKNEGTSRFYVPDSFPAVPDFDLTAKLIETAREMVADQDINLHYGIGSCDDAFFGETPEFIADLMKYGCMNIEMEASGIFTVAHKRGVRAAAIFGASVNLATNEIYYDDGTKESDNQRLVKAWDEEIKIVLETIYRLEMEKQNNK